MNETFKILDTNKEIMYSFRFGNSNKLIQLNEQQLGRIPYLSSLIAHKNNFSSIQNENGEYVLSSRIRYNWFIPILHLVSSERPSVLFTELSQDVNVLGMLKLYDYLCIEPLSIPLMKDALLTRSNSINTEKKNKDIKYYRASVLEARDTAVQFIIAISKNEYNFEDFHTLQCIFSLIKIILSNPDIFSPRLCHHTMTVVEKYCLPFFPYKQQCQLYNIQQSGCSNKNHTAMCSNNDGKSLPEDFQNIFAWKGKYISMDEKNSTDNPWNNFRQLINYRRYFGLNLWDDIDLDLTFYTDYYFLKRIKSFSPCNFLLPLKHLSKSEKEYCKHEEKLRRWLSRYYSINKPELYILQSAVEESVSLVDESFYNSESYIYQMEQKKKKLEAQSARSGYFNTLPKRTNIDRFKHRFGSKTKTYR